MFYKPMLKKTDIEPLVIEAIRELIKKSDFSNEIKAKIGKQFDTTTLDKEFENYHSKLKETMQHKNRLEVEIDTLPLDAKFRERKISDMTKRLDSLYDFIYEIENKIDDVNVSLKAVEEDTLTLEYIYST